MGFEKSIGRSYFIISADYTQDRLIGRGFGLGKHRMCLYLPFGLEHAYDHSSNDAQTSFGHIRLAVLLVLSSLFRLSDCINLKVLRLR